MKTFPFSFPILYVHSNPYSLPNLVLRRCPGGLRRDYTYRRNRSFATLDDDGAESAWGCYFFAIQFSASRSQIHIAYENEKSLGRLTWLLRQCFVIGGKSSTDRSELSKTRNVARNLNQRKPFYFPLFFDSLYGTLLRVMLLVPVLLALNAQRVIFSCFFSTFYRAYSAIL